MRRAGRNNALPPVVDRQPHRHPAHRRQVRRQLRRAGRARGGAHAERPRHRDRGADRGRLLDQRGRLALRAGDDGLGRVRQGLHAGARLCRHGHRGQDGEGRARAHRLRRRRGARRAPDRRLLRDPHRAGPGAGGRRQDHRRGHRRARHPLVRLHRDRHGGARRPDADGAAQGRAAGRHHADAGGGGMRARATRRTAAARSAWCRCTRTAAT